MQAGHAAGDRLLSLLGHQLKQCTRGRDTIARLGGDEFAVLLENCDLADAERRANSLISAIRDFRCPWGDHVLRVGASAGLVSINDRSESVEAVLRAADVACGPPCSVCATSAA